MKKIIRRLERTYLDRCGFGSGGRQLAKIVASVESGDTFLDAGCGEGSLRQQLPQGVYYIGLDRYFGAQQNEYSGWSMRPSIVGDVHKIPLAAACCKTVALMQVLEHVYEPAQVFKDIYRVLVPGGLLFLTVPFLHEIHHAPHDYYRYTPYSLTRLSRAAGFEIIELRPSGGYFRALAYLLEAAPVVVSGSTLIGFLVRTIVAYPLKGMGWLLKKFQYLLDMQDSSQSLTCGYQCIFRKPVDEPS